MTQGKGVTSTSGRSNLTLGTELTTAIIKYQQDTGQRINVSNICREALWEFIRGQGLQSQLESLRQQLEPLRHNIQTLDEEVRDLRIALSKAERVEQELRSRLSRIAHLASVESKPTANS